MLLTAFLVLVGLACAISVARWRLGPFLMIGVCMLQDPVRKMAPGVPGFLVLSAAAVWGATSLGALLSGDLRWRDFRSMCPHTAMAALVFIVLLVPSAIRSATYSPGSWQVTLIGLFIYGSLFVGIVMGIHYPTKPGDMAWLMGCYVLLAAAAVSGGLLESLGYQHTALGTERLGHSWVTFRTGTRLQMMAGFFRGPDVQGWHAATVAMFAFSLAVAYRGLGRLFWVLLSVWGVLGVVVCARRKMLSMVVVFLVAYILLHVRHGRIRHLALVLMVLLVAGGGAYYAYGQTVADPHLERFYLSTLDTASGRVEAQGFWAVLETVKQAGFLGYGVGMATQGTQHINVLRPMAWQESGPTKLVAELGVPGTVGFLALAIALFLAGVSALGRTTGTAEYPLFAALASFLMANMASAVVSAQILGDPFVAAFLSLSAGMLLAGLRVRTAPPVRRPARPEPAGTAGEPAAGESHEAA